MYSNKTLEEALKEVLKDDNKVSKFEARVLREIIMADGKVSTEERQFLHNALENNSFDEEAFAMLSQLLLRANLKK